MLLWNGSGGTFFQPGGIPSQRTVLSLSGLPQHNAIGIGFLLAIIDSWDAANHPSAAPDFFNIAIDGVLVFRETFSTLTFDPSQGYVPPPSGQLVGRSGDPLRHLDLGFGGHSETAYNMALDPFLHSIAHSGDSLTIEWWADGGGWHGGLDQSWGIDNLTVDAHVPETSAAGLLLVILPALGVIHYVGSKFTEPYRETCDRSAGRSFRPSQIRLL